jgi:hypothetical protein
MRHYGEIKFVTHNQRHNGDAVETSHHLGVA